MKRSADSSSINRASCRLCGSDFAIRPRLPSRLLGISGHFLAALRQNGSIPFAVSPAFGLAQNSGLALVDLVADLAQQLLSQPMLVLVVPKYRTNHLLIAKRSVFKPWAFFIFPL